MCIRDRFATFNRYTNCPVAYYKGQMYNMPFNMNTFHKIWGVITPAEAKAKIEEQVKEYGVKEPKNLEAVSYTHLIEVLEFWEALKN